MIDLNSTIATNSPFYLLFAVGIDDQREIIATAFDSNDNQVHSVLLSPAGSGFAHVEGEVGQLGAVLPRALPENIRQTISRRFGIRRK